jgi:hypothetical protein
MSHLKPYTTVDPYKSKNHNEIKQKELTKEVKHKLKLIEKAFR